MNTGGRNRDFTRLFSSVWITLPARGEGLFLNLMSILWNQLNKSSYAKDSVFDDYRSVRLRI